jgi:hypothetical protein
VIKWFPAKYASRCTACREGFREGDLIGYMDDAIVAQDCCAGTGYSDVTDNPDRPMKDPCPKCFIIHATAQTECE